MFELSIRTYIKMKPRPPVQRLRRARSSTCVGQLSVRTGNQQKTVGDFDVREVFKFSLKRRPWKTRRRVLCFVRPNTDTQHAAIFGSSY